jgi:archaellum component FlaC
MKWASNGEEEAIKHIEESMDVIMPDNQLGIPDACYTKIHHIKEAIKELEREIKNLKSAAKEFNIYGSYMNNNNNNNSKNYNNDKNNNSKNYKNTNDLMLGGKRRKTRRVRKTRYSKK